MHDIFDGWGAESRTRPLYWTSKDHLLFEELTISAIVERREYSGQDKWVVVVEKLRYSDGWEHADVVSRHACRDNAEAAAVEWMENLADTVIPTVIDVTAFLDDGGKLSGDDLEKTYSQCTK